MHSSQSIAKEVLVRLARLASMSGLRESRRVGIISLIFGALKRIRTSGLQLRKLTLYPLNYEGIELYPLLALLFRRSRILREATGA